MKTAEVSDLTRPSTSTRFVSTATRWAAHARASRQLSAQDWRPGQPSAVERPPPRAPFRRRWRRPSRPAADGGLSGLASPPRGHFGEATTVRGAGGFGTALADRLEQERRAQGVPAMTDLPGIC